MKNKTLFATLILMITMLLGSAMTTYAGQQSGYFDEFEGGTIVGWGWDPSTPNTAVPVRVTVVNKDTNELVGDFHPTAAVYRSDLKDNGIGNGKHGFRINMDWDSLPDGTYLIEGWTDSREFGNSRTYVKGAAKAKQTHPARLHRCPLQVCVLWACSAPRATAPATSAQKAGDGALPPAQPHVPDIPSLWTHG